MKIIYQALIKGYNSQGECIYEDEQFGKDLDVMVSMVRAITGAVRITLDVAVSQDNPRGEAL